MPKTSLFLNVIPKLRQRYYQALSGKESLIKLIAEAEVPEQVYNSNAIENSTLTLEETEKILLQIELDRYISEREIFEARNLARVVAYLEKTANTQNLTMEMMLFLHKMLLANIRDEVAGRWRANNEFVRVGRHIGAHPKDITPLLEDILMEYHAFASTNIIKRIAKFHLAFEHIHPFIDGNGRIGRVLTNYLLLREGYVPINIKFANRAHYYDAFRQFDNNGDTIIMERIVGLALSQSYHKRLAYLEDKKIISLQEYAQLSHQSHSNLLNKANRQTIEAFLEKNRWCIGVDRD